MITIKQNSYDGIVIKPELDDALEHYGVKGMKWKKRKAKAKKMTEEQKKKYNARKMADDVISGRRKASYKYTDVDPSNGLYVSKNVYKKQKGYSILGGSGPADHRKGQQEVQATTVTKKGKSWANTEIKTKYAKKRDVDTELKKRKKRKK